MNEHEKHEHEHEHHEHIHTENCGCAPKTQEALGAIHVESHLHDQARVISGSLTLFADYGVFRASLSKQLEGLAKAVQACGGIVGHIKASAETKQTEMFSVTDTAVSVKTAPGQEIRITLAAIVFAVDPEEAETLVISALKAVKTDSEQTTRRQ
jgi:hypothetical protein